ncbi:hypothetical protein [Shinella sp. NM-101]|uniref:hypothetical protein n=1 Tax=Shinella sp. NM-101 TaxID=2744455 RepID=UPI0009293EF8|nr:hypothetical protein [Shinella sp. NM-101]MBN9057297.1 hypothetical protein [Hyphomicrobiales bacterium]OJV00061.1 MAG: hypothetical protein BGO06_10095 [Shinella sp. 65-6]
MATVDADLVCEILKRIQIDIALLKEGQRDLRQDNLSIRNQIHSMQGDINSLRGTFAQMDQRLDRIENRLELRELAEAQARFEEHP